MKLGASSPESPVAGKSHPKRSVSSLCSDKFMRVSVCPVRFASCVIRELLPTPGAPSSSIGLGDCIARNIRPKLKRELRESNTYCRERNALTSALTASSCMQGIENEPIEKRPLIKLGCTRNEVGLSKKVKPPSVNALVT